MAVFAVSAERKGRAFLPVAATGKSCMLSWGPVGPARLPRFPFPAGAPFLPSRLRQLLRDAPWPRSLPWALEAGVPGPVWGRRSLRWRMSGPGGGA